MSRSVREGLTQVGGLDEQGRGGFAAHPLLRAGAAAAGERREGASAGTAASARQDSGVEPQGSGPAGQLSPGGGQKRSGAAEAGTAQPGGQGKKKRKKKRKKEQAKTARFSFNQ